MIVGRDAAVAGEGVSLAATSGWVGAKVVVLVPAHNEEEQIADTLDTLVASTITPQIVVVSDNSTDRTVEIAAGYARRYPNVILMESVDNHDKKSGALNQAWHRHAQDADWIFTQDADTTVAPDTLETLVNGMTELGIDAACAWPELKPVRSKRARDWFMHRLVQQEYADTRRVARRRRYATEVLAGLATMFRGEVVRAVAADRGGDPWATDSIVEDFRIGLDARRLGYKIGIVKGARAFTDGIVELKALWRQRVRWASGTWQELFRYGWKPFTRRTWLMCFGSLANFMLRAAVIAMWVSLIFVFHEPFRLNPIWLLPVAFTVLNRLDVTTYIPDRDYKDWLLAFSVIPIEAFSLLREVWTAWSLGRALFSRKGGWSW